MNDANNTASDDIQVDEDVLTHEVSDEALVAKQETQKISDKAPVDAAAGIAVNDNTPNDLDQTDKETLNYEGSDEALEAAAVAHGTQSMCCTRGFFC